MEAPPLHRSDLDPDPIVQFGRWYEQAAQSDPMPDATCLATVDAAGSPDARMVLLKGYGRDGFRFFTNEASAKGLQLAAKPAAALVFHWIGLERQVRIRGEVARLSGADSDAYFATRSRDSQLGAWASPQSERLINRDDLERRLANATARFAGRPIPRPPHWGGYRLVPVAIELWQGRPGRIHDRFRYVRAGHAWRLERLGP